MKSNLIITICILLFSLSGCTFSYSQNKREQKILEDWKIDSLGCLGYRNKEKAYYLLDSLDLMNKSKDFVFEKIGTPNNIKKNENTEIFKYYFNTLCRDGVFIDSADYCWFEVIVESNQIKNTGIYCY
jgi:hypothetical protein